jgi:hypothetical protein
VDTVGATIDVLADVLSALRFDRDRMRKALAQGFVTATEVADYLVTRGVPFREAHGVAGRLVGRAIERKCDLAALPPGTRSRAASLAARIDLAAEEFCRNIRASGSEWLEKVLGQELARFFREESRGFEATLEELNMAQYRHLRQEYDALPQPGVRLPETAGQSLRVSVEILPDGAGVAAQEARVGDAASVIITDERDIAQYLSGLMGGRDNDGPKPLPCPIEEIRAEGEDDLVFHLRLSAGILGLAQVRKNARLKIAPSARPGLWSRVKSLWEK